MRKRPKLLESVKALFSRNEIFKRIKLVKKENAVNFRERVNFLPEDSKLLQYLNGFNQYLKHSDSNRLKNHLSE